MDITPQHEQTGRHIAFDQLPAPEIALIVAIARRAIKWVIDFRAANPRDGAWLEPNLQIMVMDIATVHALRGLNLKRFFEAPDDYFLLEIVMIGSRIERDCAFFPDDVPLRYCDPAAKPAIPVISTIPH